MPTGFKDAPMATISNGPETSFVYAFEGADNDGFPNGERYDDSNDVFVFKDFGAVHLAADATVAATGPGAPLPAFPQRTPVEAVADTIDADDLLTATLTLFDEGF